MQKYWRLEHASPEENTPVQIAQVIKVQRIFGTSLFWVRAQPSDGSAFLMAHDIHRLRIKLHEWVYIHGNVVAERAVA
jgi:hypothetical protein